MNKHTGFRALAGFMGVYHIIMGLAGIVSGDVAARAANILWNATVTVDPQFSYLAKFLGAYVLAFGVMMLAIAKDPVRYGPLVYVAALLGATESPSGCISPRTCSGRSASAWTGRSRRRSSCSRSSAV